MLGSNQVLKPQGWVTEEGLWGSLAERSQSCRRLCLDPHCPGSIREGLELYGTSSSSGVRDVGTGWDCSNFSLMLQDLKGGELGRI